VTALRAIGRKLDDWVNPIAVKELRQATQAWLIAGLLLLFLAGLLVTTMALVSGYGRYGYERDGAGAGVFLVLYGILLGTCTGLVPAYCGGRLLSERTGAHADLLFATGLRSRSIVWGKFSSGMLLLVLIYSACAPFLAFTYLLRGIDLSTIFVLLGFGFVVSSLSLASTIFLACVPAGNLLRGLLGLVWLGITFVFMLVFMGGLSSLIRWGGLAEGGFWIGVATLGALTALSTGFLFVASVALLSPLSANRMLPVRVYVGLAWLLTAGVLMALRVPELRIELTLAWGSLCIIVFCCALLAAISERDQIGLRVARTVPRSPWLRPFAFLFYTGAAGGLVWSCLMISLTLLVMQHVFRTHGAVYPYWSDVLNGFTPRLMGLAIYALAYALTGYVLQRNLMLRAGTGHAWVLALVVAAGTFLFPIVGYVLRPDPFGTQRTAELWALGTPLLVFDDTYRLTAMAFAGAWAGLALLCALPRLRQQVAGFRPFVPESPHASPPATATTPVTETRVEAEAGPS
jgi:hypothetical protein